MTTNPGKCCQRWVYVDMNTIPVSFSKEAKGKENSNIPFFSPNAVKILLDLLKNPDAWREDRDDSGSGLPGVGPTTGKLKQRGIFCGDTLKELEGPPQYDWGPGEVG